MRILLLLLVALHCAGCRKPESRATLKLGMMPKLVGISYFTATEQGAKEAAAELGVELIYDGPTEARSDDQAAMLNSWLAQGVDAIAVAPNDPEAIARTLQDARDDKVAVLTWDTDANPSASGRRLFVNQAPNLEIGNALVDVMAEGVRGRGQTLAGKYLIVSGTPTAANQNAWMQVMRARIAEKYPEMELLQHLTPGEDLENARVQTAEALSAHPDLKGIWGITSVALPAAAKAARDAGRAQDVYVTGLSLPSLMRQYVDDGTVEQFVLWDAVDLGYLTVHVAHRLWQSDLPPGQYDFGRLKGIRVTADEAILGPPLIFRKDNIARYQF